MTTAPDSGHVSARVQEATRAGVRW